MTNIRDIAKECNLSVATVSRYINKKGNVSDKAALKIEKAIEKLDYTPNELARALFTTQSKIIGLIFPDFINPYFGELATILGEMLQRRGYKTILCFTEDDKEREMNAIKTLLGYKVDGIFVARGLCKDYLSTLDVPIVSFESSIKNATVVVADNYQGGKLACKCLINKNRKKLVHLRGPHIFEATEDRYKGFMDEAKENNVDIDIIEFDVKLISNEAVNERLKKYDFTKYDGIFAFNDILAGYLVDYLKSINIKVPEDISVIGFDNSYMSKFMTPRLTTLEQSISEIAKLCYMKLMDSISKGVKIPDIERVPVKLIERESV